MLKGKVNTKLGAWLKAATTVQQEELCERCGTTRPYLRLLSNAYRENPKLRLALSLVNEANSISTRHNCFIHMGNKKMPYLELLDLATPTRRGYTPKEEQCLLSLKFGRANG